MTTTRKFIQLFLVCVSGVALTSAQFRCEAPSQWEGDMYYGDKLGKSPTFHYRWAFDSINERIATTVSIAGNSSVTFPPMRSLVLYKEHIAYEENLERKTCKKSNTTDPFPGNLIQIPPEAKFVAPLYIGAESYSLGVKVGMWYARYNDEPTLYTVTQAGCIPVSIQTIGLTGVVESFYNIKIGVNPDRFVPSPECP